MSFKRRLFNIMFFRNMLSDFGFRSNENDTNEFPHYFKYILGQWKSGDYYLYFTHQPYLTRYKNEIFNKMKEFSGSGINEYLQFHYDLYEDKTAFLSFLKYEIFARLQMQMSTAQKIKIKTASEWVDNKLQENKPDHPEINSHLQRLTQELSVTQNSEGHWQTTKALEEIKLYLNRQVEVLNDAEQKLQEVARAIPTGNVELNNQRHEDRLVQLFILLSTITSGIKPSAEQLFKNFSQSDISSILKNHFTTFKDKKYNTIQKTVTTANQHINWKNPKLIKLNESLADYFYN